MKGGEWLMDICLKCGNRLFSDGVCSVCGSVFSNNNSGISVGSVSRPKVQSEVELAFVIDSTDSTSEFSAGVLKTAKILLDKLSLNARRVCCWLVGYGDKDFGQEPVLLTDCGMPDQVLEDMRQIIFYGGGDSSEHHLDGIEYCLHTVPWTKVPSRSRGAIVGFMTADSKPATSGITASELGAEFKKLSVFLCLVCQPTPTLEQLVSAADGLLFEISNDPKPEEFNKIAGLLTASIAVATMNTGTDTLNDS